MTLHYPQIDTLSDLLKDKNPVTVSDTCSVVRDWLAVRGAMAFELGASTTAAVLDRAAAAAMR